MKIFTLFDKKEIPEKYAKCIEDIRLWYDLEIILFERDSINFPDVRHQADTIRILKAVEFDSEDCLYIDADFVRGTTLLTADCLPSDKVSFYNCIGGNLDHCALYKPKYMAQHLVNLIPNGKYQLDTYHIINRLAENFGRIRGYPNDMYFRHMWLTAKENKPLPVIDI